MSRQKLTVAVSIDVEEEGLFSGIYDCHHPSVKNVSSISRLDQFISRGVRPTLFCAWSVLNNRKSLQDIASLGINAELGAHLHHWNTPPLVPNIPESGILNSVPASQVSPELIKSKIKTLQTLAQDNLGRPFTSFRMGRWDMHSHFFPLLPKRGIFIDASIRPYHTFFSKEKGPDHFSAPSDPYWIYENRLLEVPLTVVPITPGIKYLAGKRLWQKKLSSSVQHWGALALLPVQHPLWLLKLVANMHVSTGGTVLSVTWHSSEMHPGAAPHIPDETSVAKFINKMMHFFDWLEANFDIQYATMTDLYQSRAPKLIAQNHANNEDWHACAGF